MSFETIIDEELATARTRILQRVNALLMGGAAPAAPVSGIGSRNQEVQKMAARALAFVEAHPGSYGKELAEHLGTGSQDPRYKRAMQALIGRGDVVTRGNSSSRIYYLATTSPAAPSNLTELKKKRQRGRRMSSKEVVNKRTDAILKWLAKHPNSRSGEVHNGCGFPHVPINTTSQLASLARRNIIKSKLITNDGADYKRYRLR